MTGFTTVTLPTVRVSIFAPGWDSSAAAVTRVRGVGVRRLSPLVAISIAMGASSKLPAPLEAAAQVDGRAVHDQQEAEQHDDRAGGAFHERALRAAGPQVDLYRQHG